MKNKIVVSIYIPKLEAQYDVFIPVSRTVKSVIKLCSKSISELSDGVFPSNGGNRIYNKKTGQEYNLETLIKDTDIRNGTDLILL